MFLSPFSVDGVHFICMEQYYTVTKAWFLGEFWLVERLFQTCSPIDMKTEAKVLNEQMGAQSHWRENAVPLILKGVQAKFEQNYTLAQLPLSTGEASPTDYFWGAGMPIEVIR